MGLGGNPSLENLDRDLKKVRRRTPTERKYYSYRLVIHKQIKTLIKGLVISETSAAENLETKDLQHTRH